MAVTWLSCDRRVVSVRRCVIDYEACKIRFSRSRACLYSSCGGHRAVNRTLEASHYLHLTLMHPLLVLAIVFALVALLRPRKRRTSSLPLPPGPKRLPVIGNLLNRPSHHVWLTYSQWAKQFDSDLVSMQVLGQTVIIVNSTEIAQEFFKRRSTIYSNRPSESPDSLVASTIILICILAFRMLSSVMKWDWNFAFMRYSDYWRWGPRYMSSDLSLTSIGFAGKPSINTSM